MTTCCGKRPTPYRKEWQGGESWEEGFRCKACGAIRLPVDGKFKDDPQYMNSLGAIREAGVAWEAVFYEKAAPGADGSQGL